MPSRAFGDLRLKHKDFNYHSFSRLHGYRNPIPEFEGPYITHEPDIQIHTLSSKDKWMVLASDGLWDEIKRKHLS
jgi:pyruvate dehydrogenase phosphatase